MSAQPGPGNQFSQAWNLPAPQGGINALDNLMIMPETDAVAMINMIPTISGTAVRPGYQDWVTNLVGTNGVMSVFAASGASEYLFAATKTGIWDCTSSTTAPTKVVNYAIITGNAGFVEVDHFVNLAGQVMLLVCDDANGYYVFNTSTNTWVKVTQGFTGTGSSSGTTLTVATTVSGVIVPSATARLYTISGGVLTDTGFNVTAGVGPTYTLSGSPALGAGTAIAIIDNTSQIYGADPATFGTVRVFNNRVWFGVQNSAMSYYLPSAQMFGQVTAFNLGSRFSHGGQLANMYVFTYGSSLGTYMYLVFMGTEGDVVAYAGNDPNAAASWTMSGMWYVGDLPAGRRVANIFGGDLNMLCAFGILPLSALFSQKDLSNPAVYLSRKISPKLSQDIHSYGTLKGFALIPWPDQNSVIVTEPIQPGITKIQFCYNLATQAWSVFNGINFQHGAMWNSQMYVGTNDGRIVVMTGGMDGVARDGTGGTAIQWGVQTAYQHNDAPGGVIIDLIRVYFSTVSPPNYLTFAKYDYDITDPAVGTVTPPVANPGTNLWDVGLWDIALWSGQGNPIPDVEISGATGQGQVASIGVLGSSLVATTIIGFGVSQRPTNNFF